MARGIDELKEGDDTPDIFGASSTLPHTNPNSQFFTPHHESVKQKLVLYSFVYAIIQRKPKAIAEVLDCLLEGRPITPINDEKTVSKIEEVIQTSDELPNKLIQFALKQHATRPRPAFEDGDIQTLEAIYLLIFRRKEVNKLTTSPETDKQIQACAQELGLSGIVEMAMTEYD